ncbi:hypothetical protein F2P56_024848 [Juglans regia]|uniref:Uncharacterized protein n=1 Tax=Juglans regia TaxID=51240 RepID=A0A833UN39_JUGRE|nr:hypothetical protein F2P56_024848 [Juglans regia]
MMARTRVSGGCWDIWSCNGIRASVNLVPTEFSLEAEIRVLEEHAGVEEARAAYGDLMKRGPAAGRAGGAGDGGGEKIGDNGGDSVGALVPPANGADQRRELGADAGEAGPVARVVIKLEEDAEQDVFREL